MENEEVDMRCFSVQTNNDLDCIVHFTANCRAYARISEAVATRPKAFSGNDSFQVCHVKYFTGRPQLWMMCLANA